MYNVKRKKWILTIYFHQTPTNTQINCTVEFDVAARDSYLILQIKMFLKDRYKEYVFGDI